MKLKMTMIEDSETVKKLKNENARLVEAIMNSANKGDMLDSMFAMQRALQYRMFGKLANGPKDSVEDFHYSITALVSEIGEVLSADKRWKNARNAHYDRNEKLFELVDCMAFLVNAIQYSGFTAEEFYEAFANKNQINMDRIEKE